MGGDASIPVRSAWRRDPVWPRDMQAMCHLLNGKKMGREAIVEDQSDGMSTPSGQRPAIWRHCRGTPDRFAQLR
jgi:hypothetical protein